MYYVNTASLHQKIKCTVPFFFFGTQQRVTVFCLGCFLVENNGKELSILHKEAHSTCGERPRVGCYVGPHPQSSSDFCKSEACLHCRSSRSVFKDSSSACPRLGLSPEEIGAGCKPWHRRAQASVREARLHGGVTPDPVAPHDGFFFLAPCLTNIREDCAPQLLRPRLREDTGRGRVEGPAPAFRHFHLEVRCHSHSFG